MCPYTATEKQEVKRLAHINNSNNMLYAPEEKIKVIDPKQCSSDAL